MFHKGRWTEDYKVICITDDLRIVWFKTDPPSPQKFWGFHFIRGGGIRHISRNMVREIVW